MTPTPDRTLTELTALAAARPPVRADRDTELEQINEYLAARGVTRCPSADAAIDDEKIRRVIGEGKSKRSIMHKWPTRRYVRKR